MTKKTLSFDGGPVGYKRPPVERQFKKGQKPPGSGRKKGSKNCATIAGELINSKVYATIDGRRKRITAAEALLRRAMSGAATGGVIDVDRFFSLVARLAPQAIEPPLIIQFQQMPGDDW